MCLWKYWLHLKLNKINSITYFCGSGYYTEYVIKHTSRKCLKLNRLSLVKNVNAKTKTIWIKKNDLKGYVAHTALKAHSSNMWYLDSGCSRHICDNKAYFDTVTKCDGGTVTFGDRSTSKVLGKCNIRS